MSNIRFRRFAETQDKWELDCFVLPNDETNGELVHFKPNKILSFREEMEPGLFAALDGLLDRMTQGQDTPKEKVRLVLGRLKNDKKTYYWLQALEEYPPTSAAAEIWKLVDSIFEKRLEGVLQSER